MIIIHFVNKEEIIINGIIDDTAKNILIIHDKDGNKYIINIDKVLYIEVKK